MKREIPPKLWLAFCQRLRDWYRGAVSIHWIQPNGAMQTVAEDMPLQSVTFQKRNKECSDTMTIETGIPEERPSQHEIIEPIRVVLKQDNESGRYNELEIQAETGVTEVTFSPGIDPALLEKLAA
jgi:hypothetical protein